MGRVYRKNAVLSSQKSDFNPVPIARPHLRIWIFLQKMLEYRREINAEFKEFKIRRKV